MKYTTIGAINRYRSESINPALHPDMVFEVYSVPVYETGHPEFLHGKEIGSTKQIVQKDDVLICKINPRINRVWVVADESDKQNIASSEWIVVRNQEYNPEFLGWYFRSSKFKTLMVSEVTGIGGSLTRAQPRRVASYPVPLLHRSEQDAIVRVLNTCATIIEAYQRQLCILDSLIKARFVEMTQNSATKPVRMGDVATYVNGFAFKPTDWTSEGLPIIRIQNLNDREAPYNHYAGVIDSKYRVHKGDILVSWATHLEAYVWQGGDAWLNQHIFRAIFDKMLINKIYYVYSTEEALHQAFKNAHGFKPTMEHIKRSDFENAIIALPPIEVQNQFASFVSQIDKSKATIQSALQKTQTLFDSLMQQYFG